LTNLIGLSFLPFEDDVFGFGRYGNTTSAMKSNALGIGNLWLFHWTIAMYAAVR
jgi:hypothetical protein